MLKKINLNPVIFKKIMELIGDGINKEYLQDINAAKEFEHCPLIVYGTLDYMKEHQSSLFDIYNLLHELAEDEGLRFEELSFKQKIPKFIEPPKGRYIKTIRISTRDKFVTANELSELKLDVKFIESLIEDDSDAIQLYGNIIQNAKNAIQEVENHRAYIGYRTRERRCSMRLDNDELVGTSINLWRSGMIILQEEKPDVFISNCEGRKKNRTSIYDSYKYYFIFRTIDRCYRVWWKEPPQEGNYFYGKFYEYKEPKH